MVDHKWMRIAGLGCLDRAAAVLERMGIAFD
jgi:hypothetical protein